MQDHHIDAMKTCQACPSLCQSVCPVLKNEGNRAVSPWGLMQTLLFKHNKELKNTDIAETVYHCMNCHLCTEHCEHDVDVSQAIIEARKEVVRESLAPQPIKNHIDTFHTHHNPYGDDLSRTAKDLRTQVNHTPHQKSSSIFFASCHMLKKASGTILDAFSLLKKIGLTGIDLYTDPVQCCGQPLYVEGAEYDFVDLAEINFQKFGHYQSFIIGDDACSHTVKKTYHHYDLTFGKQKTITSLSSLIAKQIKKTTVQTQKTLKYKNVLFLPPCSGIKKTSPLNPWIKEQLHDQNITATKAKHSVCLGSAIPYSVLEPERFKDISQDFIEILKTQKPDLTLTTCPHCLEALKTSAPELNPTHTISFLNQFIEGTTR